jgi:hypothetical protein
VALQGDLQSFALTDVLRLLAGTAKSGRLAVTGDDRTGDLWLDGGRIVGGGASSAPHATDVVDVVFELLRFDGGSFAFLDDEQAPEASGPTEVDDAITRAEALLQEWAEVEAVVPSMDGWVTFAPEIDGDHTTVSAEQWRVLAALGAGLTVRDLGAHFEQTDLVASRQVKGLVEAGLVSLGAAPADRPAPVAAPQAAVAAPEAPTERDDLSVLRADDGPVVIETSEDALLPEPLPGAGTSFEGELDDLAAVDGRTSDPADATDELGSHGFDPDAEVAHGIEFGEPDPPVTHFDDGLDQADSADQAGSEPFGAADDFFGEAGSESASTEETDADPLVSTPSTDADGGSGDEGDDPDRGALLDFLSSVKP